MELKPELLKAILQYVLDNADGKRHLKSPSLEDLKIPQTFSHAEIAYHVQLCFEAKLIATRPLNELITPLIRRYEIAHLTLLGHQHLSSPIQNPVWDMLDR